MTVFGRGRIAPKDVQRGVLRGKPRLVHVCEEEPCLDRVHHPAPYAPPQLIVDARARVTRIHDL